MLIFITTCGPMDFAWAPTVGTNEPADIHFVCDERFSCDELTMATAMKTAAMFVSNEKK